MDIFSSWLVNKLIAHRGLHDKNAPENSLKSFENAIKANYAIEFDVHTISDGTIVVFHDDSLKRVTNKDGYVKNLKKEDLKNYKLNGTDEVIPTLKEVLTLINGQVPILIEIKNKGKIGELEKSLLEILKNYKGQYAIQSFNPYSLQYFRINAPEVLRGQISGNLKDSDLSFIKKYFLKHMLLNKKVSQPNFITYEANAIPNRFIKKYSHLPLLVWTVRSQDEYKRVIKYCNNIIFEDFKPKKIEKL